MSAIAGMTSPTIIRGIMNPRNSPKSELNVLKVLTIHSGTNIPTRIPAAIAMAILARRLIFSFFMGYLFNSGVKDKRIISIFEENVDL
jgi:hypothetical protein